MKEIDNMATIISIVVTCISIGCSIWSFISAKKAKSYKDKAKAAMNLIDIEKLVTQFDYESKKFVNATRNDDWFKGINPNNIISPFSDILSQFNAIYPTLGNPQQLIDLVSNVHKDIQVYIKANDYEKKSTIGNINKISCELHNYLHKSIEKI